MKLIERARIGIDASVTILTRIGILLKANITRLSIECPTRLSIRSLTRRVLIGVSQLIVSETCRAVRTKAKQEWWAIQGKYIESTAILLCKYKTLITRTQV